MKDFAKSIRTNNVHTKVGNLIFSRAEDAQDVLDDYEAGKKENDQKLIDSCKRKATVRLPDLARKLNELKEDVKDVEKAIEILKRVGNAKVGNYMMNPSGQVEDLIKSSEKYIASGDKEGAKRLFGSMEIVFRQLKEDKEEHYKKYQEADDLLGKLNKAAGKLKSIL